MAASKFTFSKLIWILIITTVLFLARDLNPFDTQTFVGHDETQAARISEFSLNLQNGIIPPRIAPHFSFNLGYPIFNYYAPAAYWITSAIHIIGIPIPQALELSYILALMVGGIGMYLFLSHYFGNLSGLVGSIAYISSPFIAVEIFVRSNLAEMWFFALFPLALYLLISVRKKTLFPTAFILAALFTSHNIFSLVSVPLIIVYAFLLKNKHAWLAIFGGVMLSLYFWIPALGELAQVHATHVATLTEFTDHFLCPIQLWSSPWGYAGSAPGCEFDGMSFMLGKGQLLFAGIGVLFFLKMFLSRKKKKIDAIIPLVAILLLGSMFLTVSYSAFIWNIFKPLLAVFQFPWRFLLFVIFGLSFFVAYSVNIMPRFKSLFAGGVIFILLIMNGSFFTAQKMDIHTYEMQYMSDEYISNTAAFKVPEYLPTTANYEFWHDLESVDVSDFGFNNVIVPSANSRQSRSDSSHNPFNRSFEAESNVPITLNIHSASYWNILIDNQKFTPKILDSLGRPIIDLASGKNHTIKVAYHQTPLQQFANILTVLSSIMLLFYSYKEFIWKKNTKH